MLQLLTFLISLILLGCGQDADPDQGVDTGMNLIFITWDGVRVNEFQGHADQSLEAGTNARTLPHFWSNIAQNGQVFGTKRDGATMLTGNNLFMSLPGYQSITAGSPQPCMNNYCGRIETKTFIEKLVKTYDLPASKVATIASWKSIRYAVEAKAGTSFVNSGLEPLDDGTESAEVAALNQAQADDPDQFVDARRDKYTHAQAMGYLERNEPRFMWIALNDADEFAHRGNYRNYIATIQQYDRWLGDVFKFIHSHPTYAERTCVILTTDHGRGTGKDWISHSNGLPSSGTVWMYSYCPGQEKSQTSLPGIRLGRIHTHLNIRPSIEKIFGLKPRECNLCSSMIPDIIGDRFRFTD